MGVDNRVPSFPFVGLKNGFGVKNFRISSIFSFLESLFLLSYVDEVESFYFISQHLNKLIDKMTTSYKVDEIWDKIVNLKIIKHLYGFPCVFFLA